MPAIQIHHSRRRGSWLDRLVNRRKKDDIFCHLQYDATAAKAGDDLFATLLTLSLSERLGAASKNH